MKVTRRLVALVGLLRRAREPLSRERIRAEMAPLGAYEGTRDTARRKLARDLDRLGDLGLTVRWNSAKQGYVLDDRARSPKRVELSPDEAALLREAASLVVRDGANPFGPDVVGLLERFEAFDLGGSVELAVHHPDRDGAAVAERVRRLTHAAWRRRPVTFTYVHERGGERHPRSLHPWGLFSRRGRWYVVGWCPERSAKRCFRVALVEDLVVDDPLGSPRFDVPAAFDLRQEARTPAWDWAVHAPVEVRLRVDADVLPLVVRILGGDVTGTCIRRTVTNQRALWSLVMEWAPRIGVEAPPDLAARWQARLGALAGRVGASP